VYLCVSGDFALQWMCRAVPFAVRIQDLGNVNVSYVNFIEYILGHAVEVLTYKLEGREFYTR
jgi:hypothetical protein